MQRPENKDKITKGKGDNKYTTTSKRQAPKFEDDEYKLFSNTILTLFF